MFTPPSTTRHARVALLLAAAGAAMACDSPDPAQLDPVAPNQEAPAPGDQSLIAGIAGIAMAHLLVSTADAPASAWSTTGADGYQCTTAGFEGMGDLQSVGLVAGDPGLPALDFGASWQSLVSFLAGGIGPFANGPSPHVGALQVDFSDLSIQIVPAAARVHLFYSAAASGLPLELSAYDADGNLIDLALGTTEGTQWFESPDFFDAPCPAGTDPGAGWCAWDELEIVTPSASIARVELTSQALSTFLVDDVSACLPPLETPGTLASVDIKPGSDDNPINLRSRGSLPVALLGGADLDVGLVDPATATLGDGVDADTPVRTDRKGRAKASVADVNGDGIDDLLLHFWTAELVSNGDLTPGSTELTLKVTLTDGTVVQGTDGVRIVG